jgi:hypothetical protein
MGLVMIKEFQTAVIAELAPDLPFHLADTVRQRAESRAADGVGSPRVQTHPDLPGQFLHRVFIVGNAVDIGQRDAALIETEAESAGGQAWIVFDPGEALLLRRGDQLAVANQVPRNRGVESR